MEQTRKFLVKIAVYNGGSYGRKGEYIAEVMPKFFKNGNMKKSDFVVVNVVEVLKKGYKYGTAKSVETIEEIIKEL